MPILPPCRLAVFVIAAAGLLLSGCADTPRVVAGEPAPAYSINEVSYAASNRDLKVSISGNPFGGDPAAFAGRVTDAMQNRIPGVVTRFTTAPGETARPIYRVALAFNPAVTLLDSELCGAGTVPTGPAGGPIMVMGAFCRSGGVLTSATGWLDAPKGIDDPAFRALVGHMTQSLFPSRRDRGCVLPDC